MATNYPGAVDSLSNPTSSDNLGTTGLLHADQHANANDAIEAIQTELGVNPSGASATVAARLDTLNVAYVNHGAVAGTARPTADYVIWRGSVAPTNAQAQDTWENTTALGDGLISEVTLVSDAAELEITGLPDGYSRFKFIIDIVGLSAAGTLSCRFNDDATTGAYPGSYIRNAGSTTSSSSQNAVSGTGIQWGDVNSVAARGFMIEVPADTSPKRFFGAWTNDSTSHADFGGRHTTAGRIQSVQVFATTAVNLLAGSRIQVFGMS